MEINSLPGFIICATDTALRGRGATLQHLKDCWGGGGGGQSKDHRWFLCLLLQDMVHRKPVNQCLA